MTGRMTLLTLASVLAFTSCGSDPSGDTPPGVEVRDADPLGACLEVQGIEDSPVWRPCDDLTEDGLCTYRFLLYTYETDLLTTCRGCFRGYYPIDTLEVLCP
jgi:hypothetical protein